MQVVANAMRSIIANMVDEITPMSRPMVRITISIKPRAFIRIPIVVESMKGAGSAALGAAAGAIALVRSEGLPKNLRDDYTALSLAHIGYVMLHTTGLSLEDREVAELAQQGFTDYAEAITRLQGIIPGAVVAYFRQEGLPARDDIAPQVRRTIEAVWQSQSSPPSPAVSSR